MYEKTALDTTTATPNGQSQAPIMREPLVIDPYAYKNRVVSSKVSSGAHAPAPVTEETVTLSPQMAALARKEQKIRSQEQDLKKKVAELQASTQEIAELKALKEKLKNKDYSGVEDLVKYDEYTQYLIEKEGNLTPEQQQLKDLQEEVKSVKSAHEEDISKRFEAAVNDRRKAVTQLVASSPNFSSIKELKAEEAVVQHILDTWEHDSIDLSPEEAAKEVEAELFERAKRWSSLAKLKDQLDPAVASAPKEKELPPLKPAVKTLTNNMQSSGDRARPLKPLSQMSDSERWAEARRRAEEKLSKGIR